MRLINADELRWKMCYKCIDTDEEMKKGRAKWDSGLWIRYKVFEDTLILTPTVDAEPIRHGRWKPYKTEQGRTFGVYCSKCEKWLLMNPTPYCPNCGAKMDEVNENETY
jgi:hypothetical protein